MAEIIDILSQDNANAASFVVDNTVNDVPLTVSTGILEDGVGQEYFDRDDNLILLSMGISFPYSFGFSEQPVSEYKIRFEFMHQVAATWQNLPQFPYGVLNIPMDNYEWSLGVFVPSSSLLTLGTKDKFRFRSLINNMRVSMINVPSSLNGLTLHAPVFLKVLHSLPMV